MQGSDGSVTRRGVVLGSAALTVALAGGFAAACGAATARPLPMIVHKDPKCGCCTAWAKRMAADGRFAPTLVDEPDMAALKARLRVPPELAVPGMPAGSPGMEMPDGRRDAYAVIAFAADGRPALFASHG